MNEDLQELHIELKDILSFIVRVCEENDITFYMAWGSCLGAVRHHGFIPWDDDVDIYVPYSDYEKFKQACLKEQGDTYFYQDLHTDPNYFLNFAKVRKNHTTSMTEAEKHIDMHWGIGVDIFPLFEYDCGQIRKGDHIRLKIMKKIAFLPYFKAMKQGIAQKVLAAFFKITGYKFRDRQFSKLFAKIEKKGNYYMDIEDYEVYPMEFEKKVFDEGLELPFEDLTVKVPVDYDHYLTTVYGSNYMEVPKKGSKDYFSHEGVIIDCKKGFENYR